MRSFWFCISFKKILSATKNNRIPQPFINITVFRHPPPITSNQDKFSLTKLFHSKISNFDYYDILIKFQYSPKIKQEPACLRLLLEFYQSIIKSPGLNTRRPLWFWSCRNLLINSVTDHKNGMVNGYHIPVL